MNREKRLALRFLTLPFRHQLAVANALGGLEGGTDEEAFLRFFKRMKDSGSLAELWDEVESRHPDPIKPNPFDEKS